MGAMLWQYEVPWHDDAAEALRAFQADFFSKKFNFANEIATLRDGAQRAIQYERDRNDQFGILGFFESQLAIIESAKASGLPQQANDQIALLRRIFASAGPDGFGNILDVVGVTESGGTHTTRLITLNEMRTLLGTDQPSIAQAKAAVGTLTETIGRSESVCFPVYRDGVPVCWFFLGYTHD